jgi:hypothetical protein
MFGPQRVAVAERPPVAGRRTRLGDRAERREARRGVGVRRRRDSRAPVAGMELAACAQRGALAPGGQRLGEHSRRGTAAHLDEPAGARAPFPDDRVPGQASPAGQLEGDRPRRRPDLQDAAGRHALQRGRQQDLQSSAELEVLRINAVRDGVPPTGAHRSRPCSCIAAVSEA